MGTSSTSSTTDINQYQQTTFAKPTSEELSLRQSFGALGAGQQAAIQDIISRAMTRGAFDLSPADQARLDEAYRAANLQFDVGARDYADVLAGGRGLRMSDTPVAQQAIQRYGLGKAQLASEQALQGLNLGLLGNQYRNSALLGAATALPAGNVAAFDPLFKERLAGGLQHTWGRQTTNQTATPSIMSQIGQGIGLAGQFGGMLATGAGYMGGIPGLSGAPTGGLGSLGTPVVNASQGLGVGGQSFGNPYWMNYKF